MNNRMLIVAGIIVVVLAVAVGLLLRTRVRFNPLTNQLNPKAFGGNCRIDAECGNLARVDCGAAFDGPLYYVDKSTGGVTGECGGFCEGRQPGKCLPGTCPPKEWTCKME